MATLQRIATSFPKSLTNKELVSRVSSRLSRLGFTSQNTLLATSLCCDELSRPLEQAFGEVYGNHYFSMGGLAGFPFGGVTSFAAMAAHIPDGGNCFLIYGPHVGIDSTGEVGTVERIGKRIGGSCCGSAKAAYHYVLEVQRGTRKPFRGIELFSNPQDVLDAQQELVGSLLLPQAQRLEDADNPMIELPMALFDSSKTLMTNILQQGAKHLPVQIAVMGGIQINCPPDETDYFMPLQFDLYSNKGDKIQNLLRDE